jgi:hypothetical protein
MRDSAFSISGAKNLPSRGQKPHLQVEIYVPFRIAFAENGACAFSIEFICPV